MGGSPLCQTDTEVAAHHMQREAAVQGLPSKEMHLSDPNDDSAHQQLSTGLASQT